MPSQSLPDDLRGEWIWMSEARREKETYLFFRKDFMLNETPATAELWITARTFFHVFVNGRHLTFGPPLHPLPNQSYLCSFDITHLLETGENVLSVLAHNTSVARYAACRQPGGFWAQLNVEGKPFVWTNSSWHCLQGDGYMKNRPRHSNFAGFSEKIDFHFYPQGWERKECNTVRWKTPDQHEPLPPENVGLTVLDAPEFTSTIKPVGTPMARGNCRQVAASTHVSLQSLLHQYGAGVYAAETFLFADVDGEVDFAFYADNPYKLLCNGQSVKEQGITSIPSGLDLELASCLSHRLNTPVAPPGILPVRAGWNHLVICGFMHLNSAGFTMVFPELAPDAVQFYRGPEEDALPGWSLAGPLRAPLANITGSLDLSDAKKAPFHSSLVAPVNEAAHLMSYQFVSGTVNPADETGVIELRQGDYVVFDLGTACFGCPTFSVRGSDDDALDIVWAERLANGHLTPYENGRQTVDTLVLGSGSYDWMACAPRGFRYLMLVARNAREVIYVTNIAVLRRKYAGDNIGSFSCSDEQLNRVWDICCRTLEATAQHIFMDSPCKDNAQYIPDAMIQAMASYQVSGHYALGAKALAEFALAQIETGEMPALCPSDIYVNIPDYALLWPVWLQWHHMHTGDEAFVERMAPALQRLLTYFAFLADAETELLSNLDATIGAPCFLDHGTIDRRGTVTGLNALYCRALLSGANVVETLGRTDLAADWTARAGRIATRMRDLTWDADTRQFADSWHDGTRSESCSWQTNILALYGGLARPAEYEAIFARFFSRTPPYERFPPEATENPYFKFFVFETALALGWRKPALALLRSYWGGMVERGATTCWEFFCPRGDMVVTGGSLCHGYGVTPCLLLPAELAGIRPARPGYQTVFFNPCLEGVSWVKAEIPTPHGRISVNWEQRVPGELTVGISANFPLEVVPVLDPKVAASATFHVGEGVTVLGAPEAGE